MYNIESLVEDLRQLGLNCVPSKKYGRGSIIRLGVTPEYYLYTTITAESNTENIIFTVINHNRANECQYKLTI